MKVYHAINAVQKALASKGIGKTDRNEYDKYNFRGIDAVYNALAPHLSENGLVILPRVLERECVERQSKNGGALFYVTLKVEYDFVCAEDDSKHTVASFGEAMDRGDKATNKAMSAAYKYACFQAFCIPTEAHDADAETHSVMSEEEMRLEAFKDAYKRHKASVDAIKEYLDQSDLDRAAEEWASIEMDDQRALWIAPSKGGTLTTAHRQTMKSPEFSEAMKNYREPQKEVA